MGSMKKPFMNILHIVTMFCYSFIVSPQLSEAASTPVAADYTVKIDSGTVQGYIHQHDSGKYVSYRGIPYAKQPVGDLRFKPLEPVEPWDNVYDARNEGPICLQDNIFYKLLMQPQGMDEACIHINVHVPITSNSSKALPVFVFIHGGGFCMASSDADVHGPEYLMSKEVIVVTFNYRLGFLGFLSLGAKELPGNLGMRDMVEALRWVKRNIAAFGGDPDSVTIGGQSAGATATHLLTLSPMAKGLFHRAIMMSGIATRSDLTTTPVNAAQQASLFLKKLGINNTDPAEIILALREVDAATIVNVTAVIQNEIGVLQFYPVVEGAYDGWQPFLAESPYDIVSSGRSQDIPIIIGFTDHEGITFAQRLINLRFMEALKMQPQLLLTFDLLNDANDTKIKERVDKVKARYFGDKDIGNATLDNYLAVMTDSWFVYPALKLARWNSELLSSKVYLYQFSFVGEVYKIMDLLIPPVFTGAGHFADQVYLLKVNSYNETTIEPGSADDSVKQWMTSTFTNFIKSGDPTPDTSFWPNFNKDTQLSLKINTTCSVQERLHEDLVQFYDDLYL